jgi:hydrogenase-4 component F
MIALLLPILIPLVGTMVLYFWPSERSRPAWLVPTAILHLAATVYALAHGGAPDGSRWLALDPPGRIVLLLVSTLFAVCSVYSLGYLRIRVERPNRVLCTCLALFAGMMSFIAVANHLGLMWVAIEATTLASGPLLYFNRNARSLEATWKYLMVGSVGIALALLGSLFLGYSAALAGREPSLLFADLARNAGGFSKPWLHAGFVLLVVGYGTKMGLAPMHTWKPDAYGEAPGLVGALLAGCMTSCAFLAIARVYRVMSAAGDAALAGRILVFLGLFSMAIAGVFMVRQKDFKRMLAYSSVEHMGILVLGLGLGGAGIFGAFLHLINNALVKGVMFLSAGNLHRGFASKSTDEVTGALRALPYSAGLFLAGFLAVTGSPPFGPFVSEFSILTAAFEQQRFLVAAGMLVFLLIVFMGMGATVLGVVQGTPARPLADTRFREGLLVTLPPLGLLLASLVMGLAMPAWVRGLVQEAAAYVGGAP